jgi:hypothetical protein
MNAGVAQRAAALENANARRTRSAAVVADLKTRDKADACSRLLALLRDPDEDVMTIRVRRLLVALPGCGPERARRIMSHTGLSDQHVRSLTPRQRAELARAVMMPVGRLSAVARPIVARELAVSPARLAAATRALQPFVASPVVAAAARAALEAAAGVDS